MDDGLHKLRENKDEFQLWTKQENLLHCSYQITRLSLALFTQDQHYVGTSSNLY